MTLTVLIINHKTSEHTTCVESLGGEGEGYHFLHAYSGSEGLKLYQSTPVDCVLLDFALPDMNSLELLAKLGDGEKIVPVIMITGEGDGAIVVSATKLGSQKYNGRNAVESSSLKHAIERTTKDTEIFKTMERYRIDLERSNRDLELFANIVAHDLKSPLRAIAQHLSLIKKKIATKLDGKLLSSMEFAIDGAERMQGLIDALFAYARLGFAEPNFGCVDLQTALDNAKRDLCVCIEESGAVITSDRLPRIKGDPVLLTQLLQNLIGNGIKYSKDAPRIHVGAQLEGGNWQISVSDNGIGIAPAQHEKIFTIFRRLHSPQEYPGIGLGLAVCDRIVKQHEGRIWVESDAGKGSVFRFTLPALQPLPKRKTLYG